MAVQASWREARCAKTKLRLQADGEAVFFCVAIKTDAPRRRRFQIGQAKTRLCVRVLRGAETTGGLRTRKPKRRL
jgi:hypothetical protein